MSDCPNTTMYCHLCNSIMAIDHDREFICGNCGYRVPVVDPDTWDDVRDWVQGDK
jgi:DNA-directed RNA polymerase subunit M/transcription elongation factor TFIIS